MKLNPVFSLKFKYDSSPCPKNFGAAEKTPFAQTEPKELKNVEPSSLKAYLGLSSKEDETVSKQELFEYLKQENVKREDRFDEIAQKLSDKDGEIKKQAFDFLKSFQAKKHLIWDSLKVFDEAKVDGKINYKALKTADSIMPKEESFSLYLRPSHAPVVLKQSKNKDGSFNERVLDLILNYSKDFEKVLENRPDYIFKTLKNNDGEFVESAVDYAENELKQGVPVSSVMSDIFSSKDKNGNFSYELKNLNEEISGSFSGLQNNLVKNIAFSFPKDKKLERAEFIKLAQEMKNEERFSEIFNFISDMKADETDKSSLAFDRPSADFVKDMLCSSYDSRDKLALTLKKLGLPYTKYSKKDIESLKNLFASVEKDNLETFLDASIYKAGERKGQFSSDNLDKYVDIYNKNKLFMSMKDIEHLAGCMSMEEDDKALSVFHKLHTLSWTTESKYGGVSHEEKLSKVYLEFILGMLCMEVDGKATRKCYDERIEGIRKLFDMELPMSSRDAFENFITFQETDVIEKLQKVNFEELGVKTGQISQGVFKSATEEQLLGFKEFLKGYLKDKNVKNLDINLNSNLSRVVELTTGQGMGPEKTILLYDFTKGRPISELTEYKWKGVITRTQKDFENNTISKTTYKVEKLKYLEHEVFDSQTLEKYDKNSNLLYMEKIEKSDVNGVFNVKRTYPDKRVEVLSFAKKSQNGNESVEKNLESFDGTKTFYRYEDDPEGNRIIDYKITDKNGKTLLNRSVTFEVLDENHFVSSVNNKKFDIKVSKDKIVVKNLQNSETVEIELENFTKSTQDRILPLLKQLPGNELFAMKKMDLKAFYITDRTDNAAFSPEQEAVMFNEKHLDLGAALHELGHAKDEMMFKEINEKIGRDETLRKIYEEEKNAFREHFGEAQLSHISYFASDYHYLGGSNAVKEGIAETNALLSTCPKNNIQGIRSHYWQQYFPRTIAHLCGILN